MVLEFMAVLWWCQWIRVLQLLMEYLSIYALFGCPFKNQGEKREGRLPCAVNEVYSVQNLNSLFTGGFSCCDIIDERG